jgi:hypothetical protein
MISQSNKDSKEIPRRPKRAGRNSRLRGWKSPQIFFLDYEQVSDRLKDAWINPSARRRYPPYRWRAFFAWRRAQQLIADQRQ